jgi:GT2 family glycosyltransferase
MLKHQVRRAEEQMIKNQILRLLHESVRIIKQEGIFSFFTKFSRRLKPRKPPLPLYVLKTDFKSFTLPVFSGPVVSIIIPVYNQSIYTYNCLLSILENTDGVPYEVIIVDNASTDNTREVLSMIKNVRIITNKENVGFVDACNVGAAAARAEDILFLNNDTVVTPHWLSALQRIFQEDCKCGAVGPKMIYPDNTLQLAGNIVWRDASAMNFGKFSNPDEPEYNYVREVDYCSGAALMVRKNLFHLIGGFDPRYAPAYWEDADLCFAIRKRGYKVLYQPDSVVVHFEGISAGTTIKAGMKRYQKLNKPKFVDKWKSDLEKQYDNRHQNIFLARDRNKNKRILIIDRFVPKHDRDAGSFLMFSFLRVLARSGYRIVFWPDDPTKYEPYTSEVQQMGIEVIYERNSFRIYMKRNGNFFDCAILAGSRTSASYIDKVRKQIPKVVYLALDFGLMKEQRRYETESAPRTNSQRFDNRELYLFRSCNIIGVLSPAEKDMILSEIADANVFVIPLPTDKITATDEKHLETDYSQTAFSNKISGMMETVLPIDSINAV